MPSKIHDLFLHTYNLNKDALFNAGILVFFPFPFLPSFYPLAPVENPVYNPWITQGIPCGNPVYSTVYKNLSRTLLTIHCIHTLFHGFSIIPLLLFHYLYILPNIMFFNTLYHLLFNFSTLSTSHHQHHIFLLCIKEIKKGKEYIIMIFSMVMAKVWRICGGLCQASCTSFPSVHSIASTLPEP